MPVAAPSDRRFRRSHVRPARRRRPWTGRGRWLLAAAAAAALVMYAGYRGALLALSTEALRVTRVAVTGHQRLSQGEVAALLDGLRGQSMVTADLELWRRKLMASPWVGNASMRRILPNTVVVAIVEREPIGIGRLGSHLYLIDQQGTVIDEFGPNYAEFDLPIIDGLAGPPRDGAPLIDEDRAALAGRLLASLQAQPDLAARVSQVDVRDPRDAVVILKNDTTLVRLGDDQFVDRLQSYLELAPALRERVADIEYVDLRFDDRVYVRSQHDEGRRPRAAGPSAAERRGAKGRPAGARRGGKGAAGAARGPRSGATGGEG